MLACGWKTAGFFCAFLSGVCVLGRAINFLLNVFKSYFPYPKAVAIATIRRRASGITRSEKPRFFNPGRLNL